MSMRLPKLVNDELISLSNATGRTKSFLALEAIKEFIAREKWQVAEIQQAILEADENDFATDEDMDELNKKWKYNAN